jgi:hypothetical protein
LRFATNKTRFVYSWQLPVKDRINQAHSTGIPMKFEARRADISVVHTDKKHEPRSGGITMPPLRGSYAKGTKSTEMPALRAYQIRSIPGFTRFSRNRQNSG